MWRITVNEADTDQVLYIEVILSFGDDRPVHEAAARTAAMHTGLYYLSVDGKVVFENSIKKEAGSDHSILSIEGIVEFAEQADLDDVRDVIDRQIRYNTAIAEEGLKGQYGASIGRTLLLSYGDTVYTRAKAWAAAGSDARMSGCELPVVINSGVVCDGAKASCAAKIASAVESGLLGMQMYMHGKEFFGGEGIVSKGVENTISNINQLAAEGMAETDREIIRIMLNN